MKIPLSSPPPPSSPSSGSGDKAPVATASPQRATLESLGLRDGQATLARVLEQMPANNRSAAIRLMLDIGGQTIPVDSDTALEPGTLVRIQRSGDSLRLLESLGATATNAFAQALAQKLPAQFDIQAGLRLIASLSRVLAENPAGLTPNGSGKIPANTPPTAAQVAANATTALSPLASVMTGGRDEAAQIRLALTRVLAVLPQQSQLQPTAALPSAPAGQARGELVQIWLQNSGLFTEAKLAEALSTGSTSGTRADSGISDLKGQILRLAVQLLKTDVDTAAADLRQLRPAVSPDLIQQALQFPLTPVASNRTGGAEPVNAGLLLRVLAGMINRITVNQLHSQSLSTAATADGSAPPQTWLLELPWLNPQQEPKVAQVRIERHDHNDPESAEAEGKKVTQWRLNLALDLDALGPLYFELGLNQANNRMSLATKIWAAREATWQLVESQSPKLRASLSALGLEVTQLDCRQGQPPQTRTRLDHRLVDEKA